MITKAEYEREWGPDEQANENLAAPLDHGGEDVTIREGNNRGPYNKEAARKARKAAKKSKRRNRK